MIRGTLLADRVVSLFSGAGGLSLGFSQAGCAPAFGAEINADACKTYNANLESECHKVDLANFNSPFKSLLSDTRTRDVFAVIGGPPCQGFSTAGMRSATDPRNQLIFSYLEIVERLRPRWFLFENVEGLLTSNNGESVSSLVKSFLSLGYWVRLEKVNFAAYGLPQARKRVLIVGNRIGCQFSFPTPTHSYSAGKHKAVNHLPKAPDVSLALAGLGSTGTGLRPYAQTRPDSDYDELMRVGNLTGGVTLHHWRASESDVHRFSRLQPGQTMRDLPEELWHDSFKRRAYRRVMDGTATERRGGAPSGYKRLQRNLNALTITSAATRELIHYSEDRPLTLREAARLQSFPDIFSFAGNQGSIAQQIGNAFPPLAARLFANTLMELDGNAGSSTQGSWTDTHPALIGYRLTEATGMSPALANTERLLSALQQGPLLL
jgi:DNA (cytosine-5)-methyltransferase 1